MNVQEIIRSISSVEEVLTGHYKEAEFGKVILPFIVIRRLDCVLEPTKAAVLDQYEKSIKLPTIFNQQELKQTAKALFFNTSQFTLTKLKDSPDSLDDNLRNYIQGFSENAFDMIQSFAFEAQIQKLQDANLLYQVLEKFVGISLHPSVVSNPVMERIFEEFILKYARKSKEKAEEHFTPREVIRLMVNLLFQDDKDLLTTNSIVRKIYDPACGTGGMLIEAHTYLSQLNQTMKIEVFGQELNQLSYGICQYNLLGRQLNTPIKMGDTLTKDQWEHEQFHYCLCNPPFGVNWKSIKKEIKREHKKQGYQGRFGAGLPDVDDGALLFLQHMISKMKPGEGRIAIVFNGSPLFKGEAGKGMSEIRRWIIENDRLEAIIGLPTELFYSTGIATYIWIVSNHKSLERKGKVQLIDGTSFFQKMRKSHGNKRNEVSDEHIQQIVELHSNFQQNEYSKIFDNADFGYRRITIERPLRLNFQVSAERIARLEEQNALQKWDDEKKQAVRSTLGKMDDQLYRNRKTFTEQLKKELKKAGVSVEAAELEDVVDGLADKDATADICYDGKGNPEPDTDLRDYENVPLKQDIYAYFEREVKPHVPDAWINEKVRDKKDRQIGKVGYQLPFTQNFYKFEALRPSSESAQEILELEVRIADQIKELFA